MAAKKKSTPTKAKKSAVTKAVTKIATPVRNTPLPKVAKKTISITSEQVAKRAFEIHCGGTGGSELDNWYRAERELRAGL
ncbi:hypothetical protein BH10PLA1_BH10PLA1_12090 [soil metagenome]